jgi:capsular exopolysaccharide synthesis family protein
MGVAAAVVAAATYVVLTERPVYTATAVLRLGDARRALTSGIEAPDVPIERLASPLLSQIQLIRSRALIGSVVDSVGLRLVPSFDGFRPTLLRDVRVEVNAAPDTLRLRFNESGVSVLGRGGRAFARYGEPVHIGGVTFTIGARPEAEGVTWPVVSREHAIDRVLRELRVKTRTQTNVVDVSYTARRRLVAQRVANEVALQFEGSSARSAQAQSRRRREFLAEQLGQAEGALDAAQLKLSEFRRRAQVFNSTERVVGVQQSISRADERLDELEIQRAMYSALLTELSSGARDEERLRSVAGSPAIRENAAVGQLYSQFARHRAALDSLTTGAWRRPDSDPDVQRLRELIASAEAQLVSTISAQIDWLGTQAASVSAIRRRSTAVLGSLSAVEADQGQLQQDVEARRAVTDRIRDELQRARMAEAVELGPVEVVDLATIPYAPTNRLRALKLLLALVFGVVLGGGVAVLLEKLDTSIRHAGDVERWLQLPSLALIPSIGSANRSARSHWRAALPRRHENGKARASAEAYRVLRTNLMFGQPAAPRSLVVTSAAPSEGKTVTAANLGITFARGGARVLLIDCDLQRPALHRGFGLRSNPGLAQVLGRVVRPADVIRRTETEGLFVLPAGSRELSSPELLPSERVVELLDTLVRQFDIVILDAPPALSAADASILAALAEGVLVVVRSGHTTRIEAQRAIHQLEIVGARVLGVVLNDVRIDEQPYGNS